MKKSILLFSISVSFLNNSFSQVNDTIYAAYYAVQNEGITYPSVIKMENPSIADYQGSYHFGESEGESQLEILYSNGKLFAREEYSNWKNDTWELVSVREPAIYKKGKLYIEDFPYQLYIYGTEKGLGSTYVDTVEAIGSSEEDIYRYLQFNSYRFLEKPLGKYPETSFVKLTPEDLQPYSTSQLQIMRNEIFARKGYTFKQGGKMDTYFSQQNWYTSLEKTNNPNIDAIEKHNIDLILKLE